MRELKFRAWLKCDEAMIYHDNKDYTLISNGNGFGIVDENWLKDEDYAIMQYAGIKDKNGVDVYEDDNRTPHEEYLDAVISLQKKEEKEVPKEIEGNFKKFTLYDENVKTETSDNTTPLRAVDNPDYRYMPQSCKDKGTCQYTACHCKSTSDLQAVDANKEQKPYWCETCGNDIVNGKCRCDAVCIRCNGTGRMWNEKYSVDYPCDVCQSTGRIGRQSHSIENIVGFVLEWLKEKQGYNAYFGVNKEDTQNKIIKDYKELKE